MKFVGSRLTQIIMLLLYGAMLGRSLPSSARADEVVNGPQNGSATDRPAGTATSNTNTSNTDTPDTQQQSVVVVLGAEGTADYGQQFQTWADRWQTTAVRSGADLFLIGRSDSTNRAAVPSAANDRDELQQLLLKHGGFKCDEPLWVILIGHGTYDGRTTSFNLRGPDVTAAVLADWCRTLQRPLIVVVCSSCSTPFLTALSGPHRTIVTATKDASQLQYSRFGDAMSTAISTVEADVDQNGQTSVLEAWLFASRRTAELYQSRGQLATEHSLLDDNGDGKGSRAEVYTGLKVTPEVAPADVVDGRLAARQYLERSSDEKRLTPEQRQLRNDVEQQLEALHTRRDQMEETEYLNQLEQLLLPLSRMYQSLDASPPVLPQP